ncbi:MAG: hypothetical protein DI603_05980 [Roseateles depolymerans]|uniref:DUF2946 domain-containing protein n=1 Tax=Roseateles depolymerans TaxID=76731 RepID=A0A2W5FXY3_9BURK|nr:MAG: hypothetical protein DI603_05980 [Roseateles depolymerans]
MRKHLLQLLLPLALLLSQQGAVWHELAHLGSLKNAAAEARADGADEGTDALCTLCLAYAHLAAGMEAPEARLPLLQVRHECAWPCAGTPLPQRALKARSRGPPQFL